MSVSKGRRERDGLIQLSQLTIKRFEQNGEPFPHYSGAQFHRELIEDHIRVRPHFPIRPNPPNVQ